MAILTCEEVEELLPSLALGALDPDERALVMARLDICPGCRQQLEEYIATSEGLLGAVPQRVPPPALKKALMDRVQPRAQHAARVSRRVRLADWFGGALSTPRWVFATVVVVLVAATAALGLQLNRLSIDQARMDAQLRSQQQALAVLAGPDTLSVNMAGTQVAANAMAVMRYNPQDTVAVLQVRDLPAVPAGKAYQLWLIDADGKRDSGAVFNMPADPQSTLTLVVWSPRPMKTYARCGVSIEPAGGSPQPTGPAALSGRIG